jgi:hypothetical protein
VPHIFGKLSMKTKKCVFDVTSIEAFHKKLWASKMARVPTREL